MLISSGSQSRYIPTRSWCPPSSPMSSLSGWGRAYEEVGSGEGSFMFTLDDLNLDDLDEVLGLEGAQCLEDAVQDDNQDQAQADVQRSRWYGLVRCTPLSFLPSSHPSNTCLGILRGMCSQTAANIAGRRAPLTTERSMGSMVRTLHRD